MGCSNVRDDDEQAELAVVLLFKNTAKERWQLNGKMAHRTEVCEDEVILNIISISANSSMTWYILSFLKDCRNVLFSGGNEAGWVSERRRGGLT